MSFAVKTIRRSFLPARAGVRVLLLHEGWPRTRFSARLHLQALLSDRFHLPKGLAGLSVLVDPLFNSRLNPVIETCVDNYGAGPDMEAELDTFAHRLEIAMAKMLPEFAPFRCQPAYLYTGRPSIGEAVETAIREGLDTLVAVNLHSLAKRRPSERMLRTVEGALPVESTQPLKDRLNTQWMNVTRDSSAQAFNAILIANLECEEAIAQFWAERLVWELRETTVDAVIFVLPTPLDGILGDGNSYSERAEEAARLIMYAMFKRGDCARAVPWRIAFHPTWSQPGTRMEHGLGWPTSWSSAYRTIGHQARDLRKRRPLESGDILVVPLANLFDTLTILSNLVKKMDRLRLVTASGMGMGGADGAPTDFRNSCRRARLHSFAEMLKIRLLVNQPRIGSEYSSVYSLCTRMNEQRS